MNGNEKIPDPADRTATTAFILNLDLNRLTDDEINYLHKLRTMAQKKMAEDYKKGIR